MSIFLRRDTNHQPTADDDESDTEPFQGLGEAAPDPVAEEQGPGEFGVDEGGNRSRFGDRSLVGTDETLTGEEEQNC